MGNLATKNRESYRIDLDFDTLTGELECLINGDCHTIIDFDFDFEIQNVSHDKADYYTPECITYDCTYNASGFDGFRIGNDESCEVSPEYKQMIDMLLEDEIRDYIDENELYND